MIPDRAELWAGQSLCQLWGQMHCRAHGTCHGTAFAALLSTISAWQDDDRARRGDGPQKGEGRPQQPIVSVTHHKHCWCLWLALRNSSTALLSLAWRGSLGSSHSSRAHTRAAHPTKFRSMGSCYKANFYIAQPLDSSISPTLKIPQC